MIALSDFGFSFPRFERLRSERTTTNEEHLEAIRHMTLQNESVAATFKVLKSFQSIVCRGCSGKSRVLRTEVEPVNPSIAGSDMQAVWFYPEYHCGCARILDILPDHFFFFFFLIIFFCTSIEEPITGSFANYLQEKLEVVKEEHRAQLERIQQKLTDAESRFSRLQQENQQQATVRSRSPPDLALNLTRTEERRPGEVGVGSFEPCCFLFSVQCSAKLYL